MIHPEHRLPQSLLRITPNESHHSLQLPHPMLHHPTSFQLSIPSVILPEVAALHNLSQQFLSFLFIRLAYIIK